MKKFLLLFVVIGAVLLALPGVIGFQMESRYQALLENLEQAGLSVVDNDYQRGWFGSSARTRLRVVFPEQAIDQDIGEVGFEVRSDIVHGPLIPNGLGLGEIDSEIWVDGERLFPEEYPASMKTLVALDGGGQVRLELPPITLTPQSDRPAVEFAGLSGSIRFDAELSEAEAEVRMEGVSGQDDKGNLVDIGPTSLVSRSWVGPSGLTLGSGKFELQRLAMNFPTSPPVSLTGLRADIDSSEQQQRVAGSATYQLQTAEIDGESYGPATLQFEFDNFSAPVLLRMQQELEELNRQSLSEQQQGIAMMSILISHVSQLLEHDPGVALRKLHLVTPQGVLEGHVALQSKGLKWEEISDPQKLLEKLSADLSLRIPEQMLRLILEQQAVAQIAQQVQQTQSLGGEAELPDAESLQAMAETIANQQLEMLLAQGVIERDGEVIATVAVLSEGLMTVNGKSIPLQMFQQ